MKTNTKRIIKFALLIALITGAFFIGSNQGYKKDFQKVKTMSLKIKLSQMATMIKAFISVTIKVKLINISMTKF
jgi:hypothetical protein